MRFKGDDWRPDDKARRDALYRQAMIYREWRFEHPPTDAIRAMARVAGQPELPLIPVKKWKHVGNFTEYLATPLGTEHIIKWSPESGIDVVSASTIAEEIAHLRWPLPK